MRLFVALDIPEAVREAIGALVAKLRQAFPHGRWVLIEGAHVTLKFIGEVPSDKIGPIEAALKTIRLPNPIEMTFRGAGFFPNEKRPRVFWSGIAAGAGLGALASLVDQALEPLGIAREKRAFSPHLTLARLDSPRGLDDLRKAVAASGPLEFGRAVAREFHLYQSVLKPTGAEYTRLATFGFVGSELQ
jgi:RNA 2',3'-cyclic 3'-phosphodiesterase